MQSFIFIYIFFYTEFNGSHTAAEESAGNKKVCSYFAFQFLHFMRLAARCATLRPSLRSTHEASLPQLPCCLSAILPHRARPGGITGVSVPRSLPFRAPCVSRSTLPSPPPPASPPSNPLLYVQTALLAALDSCPSATSVQFYISLS